MSNCSKNKCCNRCFYVPVQPVSSSTNIFTLPGVPNPALGTNGDLYIDTTTGNYYSKVGNVWVFRGNLRGPPGIPGTNGSQIITGAGAPIPALGVNGDFYLDNITGNYYLKIGGVWVLQGNLTGPPGAPGAPGADGSQIITGVGAPVPALGDDGDFYLNNSNGDYYLKIGGVWVLQGNLTGPQGIQGIQGIPGTPGADGSQIFVSEGPPAPATGVDGDLYIDNVTGDYYLKIGGVWVLQGNLTGPAGAPGADGSQIIVSEGPPAPATGVDGDLYIDNVTGDYYLKIGGVWVLQGNLTGPQGIQGIQGIPGTPGADGSQIFVDDGPPAPATGVDGDLYINNDNGDYYLKIGGIWVLQGNLTGPPGPPAPTLSFADFYALMPPDNDTTVAGGTPVSFPTDGPSSGGILRQTASTFILSDIGTYQVFFQVSVTEAGQLVIALDSGGGPVEQAQTVVGRATGTSQIVGTSLITTTVINTVIQINNPTGNTPALTITPNAGGDAAVSAHLVITQLA